MSLDKTTRLAEEQIAAMAAIPPLVLPFPYKTEPFDPGFFNITAQPVPVPL